MLGILKKTLATVADEGIANLKSARYKFRNEVWLEIAIEIAMNCFPNAKIGRFDKRRCILQFVTEIKELQDFLAAILIKNCHLVFL